MCGDAYNVALATHLLSIKDADSPWVALFLPLALPFDVDARLSKSTTARMRGVDCAMLAGLI